MFLKWQRDFLSWLRLTIEIWRDNSDRSTLDITSRSVAKNNPIRNDNEYRIIRILFKFNSNIVFFP